MARKAKVKTRLEVTYQDGNILVNSVEGDTKTQIGDIQAASRKDILAGLEGFDTKENELVLVSRGKDVQVDGENATLTEIARRLSNSVSSRVSKSKNKPAAAEKAIDEAAVETEPIVTDGRFMKVSLSDAEKMLKAFDSVHY